MTKRVYCLYRVSTNKQVDHNEQNQADIPMQRKACREFADKMGWTIVREEQETGVSGFKVSAADRDKIQMIKADAEKDKFDILLVFMFDRLGRKADETPFVVEWFSKHNISVWSVQEGEQRFDSHTDRLTNYIRFWQADGESQKTAIRTKTALSQMVQEGRFRGGLAPYGYRLEASGILNKRKHEVNKLVIDEEEAKVIRMMFNLSVGSGYGRWKISTFLNEQGIKTRDGKNWAESTVGHILHNVLYMGILKSGETYSDVFPEIQIIDTSTFNLAQELMTARKNELNEKRYMPRNTSGQSMLSGNVFCGHCGGRLTLTTNGTVRRNADGVEVSRTRIRYVCYNKTRKRAECSGQTGYTMHILDGVVTKVLHQVFDRMKSVSEDELVGRTHVNAITNLKSRIKTAKNEFAKYTKEYESLKAEVVKAVQGTSKFPMDLLSELVDAARTKMLTASEMLCALNDELEQSNNKMSDIREDYNRILEWSKIFDESDMAVKKMIASYIIRGVYVHRDYRLRLEFNINLAQFELGLEIEDDALLA